MKFIVYHDVAGKTRANATQVEADSAAQAIAKAEQDSTPNNDYRLNGEVDGLGRLHAYLAVEETE